MKSKEAIERHIKELLSEMTVEEKLDELDPNIMGIEWEKIEEPMRRECLEKLENGGQMQEFIMHCRNMQKNKHVWEFRFCSMRRPCTGCIAVTQRSFHSS